MTHRFRFSLLLAPAALALAIGCNKTDDGIRSYAAPKEQPAPSFAANENAPDMPDRSGQGAQGLQWKVPAGWKQLPGDAMRVAVFQVSPNDTQALVTVVPLATGGGDVKANVVRWAGQLKLPPPSDADMPKYVTPTQISGEKANLVDMTGPVEGDKEPQRVLAALVEHDGQTWSFNLKGPASIVASQKSNFEQFVHSIQFAAGAPQDQPQISSAHGDLSGPRYKLVQWKTPAGWTETPGSNEMRVTAFRIGSGADAAEVIISRIRQDQLGEFLANINRWRGQVGLPPVTAVNWSGFEHGMLGGQPAMRLTLEGPATEGQPSKALMVALGVAGPDFWTVKMLGPRDLVLAQRDAFGQFLDSMKLQPETK